MAGPNAVPQGQRPVSGSDHLSVHELSSAVDYLAKTCSTLEDVLTKLAMKKGVFETLKVATENSPPVKSAVLDRNRKGAETTGRKRTPPGSRPPAQGKGGGGGNPATQRGRAASSRSPAHRRPTSGGGAGVALSLEAGAPPMEGGLAQTPRTNSRTVAAVYQQYADGGTGPIRDEAYARFLRDIGLENKKYMNNGTPTTPQRLYILLQLKYKEVKYQQFVSLIGTIAQWHYPGRSKDEAIGELMQTIVIPGLFRARGTDVTKPGAAPAAGKKKKAKVSGPPPGSGRGHYGPGYKAPRGPGSPGSDSKELPGFGHGPRGAAQRRPAHGASPSPPPRAREVRRQLATATPPPPPPPARSPPAAHTPPPPKRSPAPKARPRSVSPYGGVRGHYGRSYSPPKAPKLHPEVNSPSTSGGTSSFRSPETQRSPPEHTSGRSRTPPPEDGRGGAGYSSLMEHGAYARTGGTSSFKSQPTGRMGHGSSPPPGTWTVHPGDPVATGRAASEWTPKGTGGGGGGGGRFRPASAGGAAEAGGGGAKERGRARSADPSRPASIAAGARGGGARPRRSPSATRPMNLRNTSFAKPTKSSRAQQAHTEGEIQQRARRSSQGAGGFNFRKDKPSVTPAVDGLFHPVVPKLADSLPGPGEGRGGRVSGGLSASRLSRRDSGFDQPTKASLVKKQEMEKWLARRVSEPNEPPNFTFSPHSTPVSTPGGTPKTTPPRRAVVGGGGAVEGWSTGTPPRARRSSATPPRSRRSSTGSVRSARSAAGSDAGSAKGMGLSGVDMGALAASPKVWAGSLRE